jgi:hypothetical protein
MTLFSSPEEHAANPPATWQVVKVGTRRWGLATQAGYVLERFECKTDAEQGRTEGWAADLYDKETRWYAGEPVNGWKPCEVRR